MRMSSGKQLFVLLTFFNVGVLIVGGVEMHPSCLFRPPASFATTSGSGKYFFLSNDALRFDEARDVCVNEGGHDLAMLNTQEDYDTVLDMIKAQSNQLGYYVGLVRIKKNDCSDSGCYGSLKWLDGSLLHYNQSVPIHPGGHNHRCFTLSRREMGSVICVYERRFICQFDCKSTMRPDEREGVRRYASKLIKVHQTGNACFEGGHLIEPRDSETAGALHLFSASAKEQWARIGVQSSGERNCDSNCEDMLGYLHDSNPFIPQTTYITVKSMKKAEPWVQARFNHYTSKIRLYSSSDDQLPFICQYEATCSSLDSMGFDENIYNTLHFNSTFARVFMHRWKMQVDDETAEEQSSNTCLGLVFKARTFVHQGRWLEKMESEWNGARTSPMLVFGHN